MELQELKIGDFYLEYTGCKEASYPKGCIILTLKTSNTSGKKRNVTFRNTRYNSKSAGIKDLRYAQPGHIGIHDGYDISANSFVNSELYFEIDCIDIGDKLELVVNDRWEIPLELTKTGNGCKWLVLDSFDKHIDKEQNNKVIEDYITSNIEHFETIEEKIGITLQNFSVNIIGENVIRFFFEVLSNGGKLPEDSFTVETIIYDKSGKIRHYKKINKDCDEFFGFEVFAYERMELDIPVEEIGKIRVYPTI